MATKKKNDKIAKRADNATKETPEFSVKEIAEEMEEEREKELVATARSLFNYSKETRRKHDWEWLVRSLYLRGYHYARYNRNTNTVTFGNRSGVKIPINLMWAHLRAVRNQVTSFRPKWEVLPSVTTESAIENARYSGKILDYIYEKSDIKRAIKEVITQALVFSVGIWQFEIGPDGRIIVRTVDPYDFYIDPNVRSANINDTDHGAEFVFKTSTMPLEIVKNNPQYQNTGEIQAQNQLASAEYKRFLMQVTQHRHQESQGNAPTVTVYEMWKRERQEDGSFKMRVMHFLDQLDRPVYNKLFDQQEYPFEIYQGDLTPLEVYGESWAKHLIPINRVIDSLESHIFEYNHLFARGRFVIDKNSGVRVIVNQHGQIIEKNRGSTVTSLPIAPLPGAPREQIAAFRTYFEDLSGAHDVTLGRIPSGVKSGVGIAELRQADATNQDDLVDNLEDFLSRSGRKILRMVAESWNSARLIMVTGEGGKPDYFMAAGENAKDRLRTQQKEGYKFGEMRLPLAIIGADNEVRVKVGSWLAYTKEARQERLKELYRLGAIDQKTLLEYLEFGDIDGVLQRTREERILQMRAGSPSQSVLKATGEELSDEQIAVAENELMLEGKEQPVYPDDDHEVHMAVHREAADDKKYGYIIRAHMNEHLNYSRYKRTMQAAPTGPEGPEVGGAEGGPEAAMAAMAGGGAPQGAPVGGGQQSGGPRMAPSADLATMLAATLQGGGGM
jgi:hypothetical protein